MGYTDFEYFYGKSFAITYEERNKFLYAEESVIKKLNEMDDN